MKNKKELCVSEVRHLSRKLGMSRGRVNREFTFYTVHDMKVFQKSMLESKKEAEDLQETLDFMDEFILRKDSKEVNVMCDKESKYNVDSNGHSYGYDKKGGWDIDTSDRTQRTSDGGHIPGRYQWEETVDVSDDD